MFKKIFEVSKKIIAWLVFSSANVEKISLTIKSLLYALIPFTLLILDAYKIKVDNAYITAIIDQIVAVIIVFGGAVTAISAAFGALRKLYTTAKGTNDVVNSFKR